MAVTFITKDQTITFDATIEEVYSLTSTVTSHPVEFGVNVNDHYYINPRQFTFTGGVTNTPLRLAQGDIYGGKNPDVAVAPTFNENSNSAFVANAEQNTQAGQDDTVFGRTGTRKHNAWTLLQKVMSSGEPFTVQAGLERFPDMVIISLDTIQDARTAGALIFNCTIQQIVRTTFDVTQLTEDELKGLSTKKNASTNKERGQEQVSGSILYEGASKIRESINGFIKTNQEGREEW